MMIGKTTDSQSESIQLWQAQAIKAADEKNAACLL